MEDKKQAYTRATKMIHEVDALNETYLKDRDMDDYSMPVLRSAQVCELLLSIYLRDMGIDVDDDGFIGSERKRESVFMYVKRQKDLLPNECQRYLDEIRKFRNMSAHLVGVSYEQMLTFKKAFDCFTSWFLLNIKEDNEKPEANELVFKLLDEKLGEIGITISFTDKEQAALDQQKRLVAYANMFSALKQKKVQENKQEINGEILAKLDKILEIEGKQDKKIDEIKDSVDVLADEIRRLAGRIEGYQSLVERQLKLASDDEEEIEHIIHSYVDECAGRIVDELKHSYGQKEQEIEENKLKTLLGDSAWNKLQESSKSFLISSRVMYNSLVGMKSKIDYSGVCLLVTKALEVELSQRFYRGFVAFLKEKYPGKSKLKEWPLGLLDRNGNPLTAEQFSMGNISEILCRWHDPRATEDQKENNREKLLDYAQEKIFTNESRKEISDLLLEYADEIETIKKNYRNPSAHTGELTEVNAKDCFDIVLDVEKLLKRMLDSFDREASV